jgi:hypothetical protein
MVPLEIGMQGRAFHVVVAWLLVHSVSALAADLPDATAACVQIAAGTTSFENAMLGKPDVKLFRTPANCKRITVAYESAAAAPK